ncbi:PEGA domain-containing protein (plasmid) [Azospirillum sp. TSA2s]|uniref:PEGA domain-containing protein n=1 Tax=Azospirillum sp. TSA2s TaxID=709810 RepID=UPI0010AB16CF|nr:PEGA domain-containing protein [Azospirillum sp. TSA2s]QCG93096.1 PEGA domain-containing protein [Azospirillum sp. TSA2s]
MLGFGAVGCIILGGAWLGLGALLPSPEAGRAMLTILSDPPRGIVRIDGVERGYAPVTIEVKAGTLVQVSVVGISGRQPRSETVSLPAGEFRTITLRLAPKLGGL